MSDKNLDLTQRTRGEDLWVWRHIYGYSQWDAGMKFDIHGDVWGEAERDTKYHKRIPHPLLAPGLKISTPVLLRLARKRFGMGSRGTAAAAGYGSHVALLKAEGRGDPKLVAYWEAQGVKGFDCKT